MPWQSRTLPPAGMLLYFTLKSLPYHLFLMFTTLVVKNHKIWYKCHVKPCSWGVMNHHMLSLSGRESFWSVLGPRRSGVWQVCPVWWLVLQFLPPTSLAQQVSLCVLLWVKHKHVFFCSTYWWYNRIITPRITIIYYIECSFTGTVPINEHHCRSASFSQPANFHLQSRIPCLCGFPCAGSLRQSTLSWPCLVPRPSSLS